MEKSDIMVWALGSTSAVALLALWCGLGLYHAKTPLGFGLAVALGAAMVLVALLVIRVELRRRYRARTFYVGDTHLFNPELGLVPLREGVKLQDALADAMEQLRYSFRTYDFPSDEGFIPRFVVRTVGYKPMTRMAARGAAASQPCVLGWTSMAASRAGVRDMRGRRMVAPGPIKVGSALRKGRGAAGTVEASAPRQRRWCGEVTMMRSGGSVAFDTPERLRAILQPLHPAAR